MSALVIGIGAGCSRVGETTKPTSSVETLGKQQPARVLGASILGPVKSDQLVDFVIGLALGHGDDTAVQTMALRMGDPKSADYGKVLTPATFAAAFSPSQSEYDALVTKLTSIGFTVTRTSPSRTTVSVRGTAGLIDAAFDTELLNYQDAPTTAAIRHINAPLGSSQFFAPSESFSFAGLGAEGALVATVTGLDDADRWFPHLSHSGAAHPDVYPVDGATPTDIRHIYNADTATLPMSATLLSGAGETVAILGAGAPPSDSDLTGFVTTYNLPAYTHHYTQVLVGGTSRETTAEQQDEGVEDDLDADMVLGVAPAAGVVHALVASNAGGLFMDGIAFVVDQVPQAHQVTVSFGSCERAAAFEVLQMNSLLIQSQMSGQTWFFSSGDDGTDGCQDSSVNGVLAVDWPASSPYVLGVGGTQADMTTGIETAWTNGGGGASELFPKPLYQMGVGPGANDMARDVPDVAALAGNPGVNVYANSIQAVNGTSAAAPIWAAIWSMYNESRDHVPLTGDYHTHVYAAGSSAAFHDIVGGNNSDGTTAGYDAVVGYDQATGWGTPNLAGMVGALK